MDDPITFTVSLDDMIDTQRLATRKYVLGAGIVLVVLGLALVVVHPVGLVVAAFGGLTFLDWRFPTVDRWLIRRRASARIGALCEVWLDESGIAYRQAGLSGHIAWSAVTRIIEDDRSLILMQGGLALIALPKTRLRLARSDGSIHHDGAPSESHRRTLTEEVEAARNRRQPGDIRER